MFENERSLLVGVTFHAGLVRANGHLCLFLIKTAVRVVTIAAVHRALKHFVTERLRELSLNLSVAAHAELRFAVLKHRPICLVGPLCRCPAYLNDRTGTLRCEGGPVSGMAVGASYVVAPVVAAAEIIVVFLAGVTRKASFGRRFRIHLEENLDLSLVSAAINVGLSRAVTRFAADHLSLPGRYRAELSVFGHRYPIELRLVTTSAGFAADVVVLYRG